MGLFFSHFASGKKDFILEVLNLSTDFRKNQDEYNGYILFAYDSPQGSILQKRKTCSCRNSLRHQKLATKPIFKEEILKKDSRKSLKYLNTKKIIHSFKMTKPIVTNTAGDPIVKFWFRLQNPDLKIKRNLNPTYSGYRKLLLIHSRSENNKFAGNSIKNS